MNSWAGIDAFVAVCESGSFTRAAERLGVSISHVSREIQQLEERLGARLIVRSTRRLNITDAGHILQDRCRKLIEERDAAFGTVSAKDGELSGHLRVTCSIAYGERTIMPLINRFLKLHPRISLEVDLTNHVIDLVADGFDLAVRTGGLGDARLSATWLASRKLYLCASPGYVEKQGYPESIYAFHSHDCLLGTATSWTFTAGGRAATVRPESRWHCNSGFGVLDAALQGMGLCQLPDFYVRPHLEDGTLVEILGDNRPPDQDIWAVSPGRSRQRDTIGILVSFLASELEATSAGFLHG